MGSVDAVRSAFQQYASVSGRASRPEYWWFALFYIVVVIGAVVVDRSAVVASIATLALIIPALTVGARRLHDIGRSGWWLLISIIPFGSFVLLYWYLKPGDPGPNQFGPPPGQPQPATA